MIALGGVPHDAVEAANRVISERVQFKEHRWASTDPRESTSHHFYSRAVRDSMSDQPRASTPGHEKTEPETHPRVLRREAHALKKEFEREKNSLGAWWKNPKLAREIAQRDAEITQKMLEADKASARQGFPFKDSCEDWQNLYRDGPRSFFEDSLRWCLMELNFSKEEVNFLTKKPEEDPPVLRRSVGNDSKKGGWAADGGWSRGWEARSKSKRRWT